MNSYRELQVWQKAVSLTTEIYKCSESFPAIEQFGITAQLRRSSVSIPSNIAEGFGRNSRADFIRFLQISIGSLFELQTQLEISLNLSFLEKDQFARLTKESHEIEKMLKALIKSLRKKQ